MQTSTDTAERTISLPQLRALYASISFNSGSTAIQMFYPRSTTLICPHLKLQLSIAIDSHRYRSIPEVCSAGIFCDSLLLSSN